MTPEDLEQIGQLITAAEQLITARLDSAVETIAGEISAFREETNQRFAAIDRQFAAVHARLDNTTAMLTLLQGTTTTTHAHIDRMDSLNANHQSATEKALAEIRRRLDALEKKAS